MTSDNSINPPVNHWDSHAPSWRQVGSPLRPCAEDITIFRQSIIDGPTVLLGVTPELADISPMVTAIDSHPGMIASVWPGNRQGRRTVRGDWLALPLKAGSQANVVGDGCPVLLNYPAQTVRLFTEAVDILRPAGRLVLRVFVSPESGQTRAALLAAALSREIGSFHAFKWRLAMLLAAENGGAKLAVQEIFEAFEQHFSNRDELSCLTGWPMADIATIDVYRGSAALYSFPTLAQLRQVVPTALREISCCYGCYELAERCPVLTWERS